MKQDKAICVYCASSANISQYYITAAKELGRLIACAGCTTVCGAGRTGLMGALIDGAAEAGGKTIGVIPRFMVDNGWHHKSLSSMDITEDMHQRKMRMAQLASAVIAMPGGCGTLEELLEIITWRQLGLYTGNIIILNINDYYKPLLDMLDKATTQGFMKADHTLLWQVAESPEEAIAMALNKNIKNNFTSKY